MPEQSQIRFNFSASRLEKGYEITFIHEGEANGWQFPASVLQDSASLWESTNVFVDHAFFGRSVRELGGVLSSIEWNEEHAALTAQEEEYYEQYAAWRLQKAREESIAKRRGENDDSLVDDVATLHSVQAG